MVLSQAEQMQNLLLSACPPSRPTSLPHAPRRWSRWGSGSTSHSRAHPHACRADVCPPSVVARHYSLLVDELSAANLPERRTSLGCRSENHYEELSAKGENP